jgi:hypothetical protein
MKKLLLGGVTAFVLVAAPALAQNPQTQNSPPEKAGAAQGAQGAQAAQGVDGKLDGLAADGKTLEPVELSMLAKKPPLKLDDQQKAAIQQALVEQHTEQKVPQDFHPAVGAALPKSMKLDVMPLELSRKDPALKQFGYAKTHDQILVIDPMTKKIVEVLPRRYPNEAKSATPADWASTKGRELTGQAPLPAEGGPAPEPAGDAGDVSNGVVPAPKQE